jgi:hypothetical protein
MYKLKNMYRIIFMNFFQNGYGNEVQTRIKKSRLRFIVTSFYYSQSVRY